MKYYAEAMKTKEDHLEYSGVKGMHWGIRRFQNKDGSLTELGKKRAAEGPKCSKRARLMLGILEWAVQ